MFNSKRRILIFLLFFIFTACSKPCGWIYREVNSDCCQFSSASLAFTNPNPFNGLELSFLRGDFGTVGYVSIFRGQITPFDFGDTKIVVFIENEQFVFHARCLEGGQRLLLSNEATEFVLSALNNSKTVTIALIGYYSVITPAKFHKYYQKFIEN